MSEQQPRWQHYVPRFYLRRFGTQDKKIAVIDRRNGEVEVKPIKRVGAEKDFYTLVDDTGKPRFDVEYALSRLENNAAVSMRRATKSWPPRTASRPFRRPIGTSLDLDAMMP